MKKNKTKLQCTLYGVVNFLIIFLVNKVSDLPVVAGNWEWKAALLANFQNPNDNFYPPGAAILLIPFLGIKPHYELVVYFYFTFSAVIYYLICSKVIHNKLYLYLALSALTLNPYLLWLVNSSLDIVYELFLLLSGFALILSRKILLSYLPLYLLCLTRPAYWPCFLMLPLIAKYFQVKNKNNFLISKKLLTIPFLFLFLTLSINQIMFKSPAIAGEAGMTLHYGHHKFWYLAMPKFDSDVFLNLGGNMDTKKFLSNTNKFSNVKDEEYRAALISITENPKSLVLNTLQKADTYFFAVQKNPQLSGKYYLSPDQKSIIIGSNRDSWPLIFGSVFYFIHRILLLIFAIAAATLVISLPVFRRIFINKPEILFFVPFLFGSIAALLVTTETRLKIVSELLLVPLIGSVFDNFRVQKNKVIEQL